MKSLAVAVAFTSMFFIAFDTPASAKTRDECMALAQQRGFGGGGKMAAAAKTDFIKSCMSSKKSKKK